MFGLLVSKLQNGICTPQHSVDSTIGGEPFHLLGDAASVLAES